MPNTSSLHARLGLRTDSSTEESQRWFERAKKVLAGGISSSARSTTTGPLPFPLYITHGRGSRIWDVSDIHRFVSTAFLGASIAGLRGES